MKIVDLLHRWGGGLLGLVLAILGLTGAILMHKEEWIGLPHSDAPLVSDPVVIGATVEKLLANSDGGQSIIFASDRFGLLQIRDGDGGQYATQAGKVVAQWSSQWERPELWLFDLHHHLFSGETGEFIIGIAGLAALVFVITGTLLWWRTRRTFKFRLWPARMTGPAVRMHHRDLGIIVAPLLFLTALTGTMMIFRPVAGIVLSPLSAPKYIEADLKAPSFSAGKLEQNFDWKSLVIAAHQHFPGAQMRIIALPKKAGDPITVRMKQEAEWLPNGRTMLWFDPNTGKLLGKKDALAMQPATQAFNMAYPIHAGKVGGLAYRFVLTLVGLALFLLGTLSVWTFWFRGSSTRASKPTKIER